VAGTMAVAMIAVVVQLQPMAVAVTKNGLVSIDIKGKEET